MAQKAPITGSFIDEITYDIPASNWTDEQWKNELDYMTAIGIDTLVFIRGGFEDKTIFPSRTIGTEHRDDFAGLILSEAASRGMDVYFGLYISNLNWNNGDAAGELRKNKLFVDEVWHRYGDIPSFKGWYIPQENCCGDLNMAEIMQCLPALCKDITPNKSVLISPYFKTEITCPGHGFTPQQHAEEWDKLFYKGGKDIDACAFQDGTAPIAQMREFFEVTAQLCKSYNIQHWVNAETFERDVRSMYYPISFQILKQKLELHKNYADKIITFEFSHFLSPQSIYPSARNLNNLYRSFYHL